MNVVSAEYSAVATLAVRLTCCGSSCGLPVSNHSLFEEGVGEETPPSVLPVLYASTSTSRAVLYIRDSARLFVGLLFAFVELA